MRAFVAALVLVAGCSPASLHPGPTAFRVRGLPDTAIATRGGLELLAQTLPWPGPTPIEQAYTPLRVVLENRSGHAIRLAYAGFALEGGEEDDEILTAVAPARMEGEVHVRELATDLDGLPYGSDPFDPYVSSWRPVRLPTPDVVAHALPQGVLTSGGRVEGWLFFDRLPRGVDDWKLHAHALDPISGVALFCVSIPLEIAHRDAYAHVGR